MGQKYEIMCYFALYFPKKSTMNLELDIARRLAAAASGSGRSVMERIATLSVALSLAVMLLSMAVIMGFKREIAHKMSAFSSHIVVTDVRSLRMVNATPIRSSAYLDSLLHATPDIDRVARYARRGGIVRTAEAVEGVVLKGVDSDYDLSLFEEWLVAGTLPRIGDSVRTKDVLLSDWLARRLQLTVNDRLEMLFVEPDKAPYRDRFKVTGIYTSGMEEMDRTMLLTDLRNVQRLSQWGPDEISGYELRIHALDEAPHSAAQLDERLFYDPTDHTDYLTAQSVQELYPGIFDWLKTHDMNAVVILTVMLIVAFFNMATALLIIVLERIRMIGVLKALGMCNRALRRIFLYRAAWIALRGLGWGNLVGVGLCLLQAHFHLIKLDAEGYLLSAVPIDLTWGWWLGLNLGFTAAILLLMWLPASVVATVKPEETMRYE